MKDTLKKAIEAIIARAKKDGKVFAFGDEIYTPAEALDAIQDHAAEEMDAYGMTEDQYIDRILACLADKED